MPKILFWNVQKKPVSGLVGSLVADYAVDIVVLAEVDKNTEASFRVELEGIFPGEFKEISGVAPRIKILARKTLNFRILHNDPQKMYSIVEVSPPSVDPFLMVACHLKSQVDDDQFTRYSLAVKMAKAVVDAEQSANCDRTMVIGDLNASPWEAAIMAAEALNAVMCRSISDTMRKRKRSENWKFFYNPMWNYLGDSRGKPGTYWYERVGQYYSPYWLMLDQILLRPELVTFFDLDDCKILTEDIRGSFNLLSENPPFKTRSSDESASNHADVPDHLPLYFDLRI
mgnify:CR=1 FL=1